MENLKTHSRPVRLLYFWIGITATLAYRAIIVLNFYSNVWVKFSWYLGTVCFIIYYIHRFDIAKKRSRVIVEHRLREKLDHPEDLNESDHQALAYILETLVTSKEKWNNYIIFISSGLALLVGIIFDFILKI